MVFFNGDRICFKSGDSLKFGRIQEYIEEPPPPPPPSKPENDTANAPSCSSSSSAAAATTIRHAGVDKALATVLSPHLLEDPTLRYSSPVMSMRRSTSSADFLGKDEKMMVKRQILWDNNKGAVELGTRVGDDFAGVYKVIDRKFTVGQHVFRGGLRGKVTEVIPLATVKVHEHFTEKGNNKQTVKLIPDLSLSEIQPISPFFTGVNIEYNGWIGQITEVQRSVTYKLEEPLDTHNSFVWTFYDSIIQAKPHLLPTKRSISKLFTYPFMPGSNNSSLPYQGKVEVLNRSKLRKQFSEEEEGELVEDEDKENRSSVKGSSSSSSTVLLSDSLPVASSPKRLRSSLSLSERKKNSKARAAESITAIVESVSVVSIKVRWTGRLPMDLIKPDGGGGGESKRMRLLFPGSNNNAAASACEEMPPAFICKKDLKLVHPLYVHPAMYFDKAGLCVCRDVRKGMVVEEGRWIGEMYKSMACYKDGRDDEAPFDMNSVTLSPPPPPPPQRGALLLKKDDDDSSLLEVDCPAGKRKRNGDGETDYDHDDNNQKAGQDVIVCKHFVRHMYKVIWEKKSSDNKTAAAHSQERGSAAHASAAGIYYGNQLEPDLSQEHKLCLGLIHSHLYVVGRGGGWMEGKWDYGVVIGKPSDDSVIVEWLKICADGNVVTVRILKCALSEVDKHPTFNELHEGRIVVRRKEAAKYKMCKQFRFGTVVWVQRFSLGQISVYCPIQKEVVLMWPHMLEVYVGMSLQDLIALNVVGLNKPKLEEDEQQGGDIIAGGGGGGVVEAK